MSVSKMFGLFVLLTGCGTVDGERVDPSKIEDFEWRLGDECPVHHRSLTVAAEPLTGLSHYAPGYADVRARLFPFAMDDSTGLPHSGKTHWWAHYCSDCRKAEREWREESALLPKQRELLRSFVAGNSIEKAGAEMGLGPEDARLLFAQAVYQLQWVRDSAAKQDATR